jgi:hypothetical protein
MELQASGSRKKGNKRPRREFVGLGRLVPPFVDAVLEVHVDSPTIDRWTGRQIDRQTD